MKSMHPLAVGLMSGTILLLSTIASNAAESMPAATGIPLFNGNDLTGFHTFFPSGTNADAERAVKVEDGTLHLLDLPDSDEAHESGYVVTDNDYRNYRIHFEYRWGEKRFPSTARGKRNSGFIYHVVGEDRLWPTSLQCQVKEGETGDLCLLHGDHTPGLTSTASDPKADKPVFKQGATAFTRQLSALSRSYTLDSATDWNSVDVWVSKAASRHFVNGTMVNRAWNFYFPTPDDPLDQGRIGFQMEGSEILYRNVLISPIAWPRKHDPFKVLVFSKTAGFRHKSIADGVAAMKKLGATFGFEVDATEDAAEFNDDNLKQYRVVIFLSTTGDVLDSGQEAAFQRYIQAGNGYVGIHAASDTEYQWPWYGELVGAYFANHPPGTHPAKVDLIRPGHVSMLCLPREWRRTDEWYNFKEPPKDAVQVLAKLDETSYQGGNMGDKHAIIWCHEYDGGRAWYTALGHTEASFTEPLFLLNVLGGIQYAAKVPPAHLD